MSFSPSVAFLTSSVGTSEWVVFFVVVLIVVGPKRLPDVARKIGRMMEMFRRAADEFRDQLMTMDQEPPPASSAPSPSGESGGEGQSDAYSDAYPGMADYPGNEGHVENWAAETSAEPAAEPAAPAGAGQADGPQAEAAGKPPEGQA